ncbi:MAG: hypothetical protein PVF93_12950 [Chromatiaceae bacterium]|jgi:hypothetical protein
MKLVVIPSFVLAIATIQLATAAQAVDNASTVIGNATPDLQQLSDPVEFADDICWVAPEWRDDQRRLLGPVHTN